MFDSIHFFQAGELSNKIVKYVSASNEEDNGVRQYWPLVECVTVRLPNKDLLQHITLVDLPGNGDRNKSRDNMWKKVIVFNIVCMYYLETVKFITMH